jgi:hypothetical protein
MLDPVGGSVSFYDTKGKAVKGLTAGDMGGRLDPPKNLQDLNIILW